MLPFAPGQIWTYRTRPGEEDSRVIVCRVDTEMNFAGIVHIQVVGVRLRNKRAPGGVVQQIGHLPYDTVALQQSVIAIQSSGTAIPDFEAGYRPWRSAFDEEEAGVWAVPLAEAISSLESMLDQ